MSPEVTAVTSGPCYFSDAPLLELESLKSFNSLKSRLNRDMVKKGIVAICARPPEQLLRWPCTCSRLIRLTIENSRGLNSTMSNPILFDLSPTKAYTCILIIQSYSTFTCTA